MYPTEKMLEIYPEVVRITREWNVLVAEGVSEEELEVFHRVLDKMVDKSRRIVYGEESVQ